MELLDTDDDGLFYSLGILREHFGNLVGKIVGVMMMVGKMMENEKGRKGKGRKEGRCNLNENQMILVVHLILVDQKWTTSRMM